MSENGNLDTNSERPEKDEHRRELEKKANDYTVRGLMDGGETGPESIGLINTSAAATALDRGGSESPRGKKERDFHRLLRLIERQIALLNEEIERLAEEIEAVEERIATKESLLKALKSGQELTEEERRLAEEYRNEDGEIDLEALHDDIEQDKKRLHLLIREQEEREAELRSLEARRGELENKFESGQGLDATEVALAVEAGFDVEELGSALVDFADGDALFESDLEMWAAASDANTGAFATEVSRTSIKAESISPSFNVAAKNHSELPSPDPEPIQKADLAKTYTL